MRPVDKSRRHEVATRISLVLILLVALGACAGSPGTDLQPQTQEETAPRVMVTLKATIPTLIRQSVQELSRDYGLQPVASWKMESLEQQCVLFEISESRSQESLVRSLERDHRIDLAQPVSRFFSLGAKAVGADPSSYRRFQHAADTLRLDQAHAQATGRGVRVAVIDTGVDIGHPEYADRVFAARDFSRKEGESFTSDLHGTAVAGLIAANRDDGHGIVGAAPAAELEIFKACWAEPAGGRQAVCDSYTLALALDSAALSASRVINLSLTGPEEPILRKLLEAALARQKIVVAALAAGSEPSFPADLAGVLAVRSLPSEPSAESTTASEPTHLSAPGEEIITTVPGGAYDFWTGSSMSAAQVSGIVALLLELRPELGAMEIERLLLASAHDNPGHGLVDACAAVSKLSGRSCPQE